MLPSSVLAMPNSSHSNCYKILAASPHALRPDILLCAICEALLKWSSIDHTEERRLGILATNIFSEASSECQRQFISIIARSHSISLELSNFLIMQHPNLAAPIVARSQNFSKLDLIALACDDTAIHHRALAARGDLPDEAVTCLVQSIDITAVLHITTNRRQFINKDNERILWQRACENVSLAQALIHRVASRMDLAIPKFHQLPYSVRGQILHRLAAESPSINFEAASSMINGLVNCEALKMLENLISTRNYKGLAIFYAKMLNITEERAYDAVYDPNGILTLIAVKSLGLSEAIAARQFLLAPDGATRTMVDIKQLLDLYHQLPLRVAKQFIDVWAEKNEVMTSPMPISRHTRISINMARIPHISQVEASNLDKKAYLSKFPQGK